MYFSIAAPQIITLPDGTNLSFRVNPADSSLVELHIVGVDGNDVPGTHVLTFKRNGGPNDTFFIPTAQIDEQPPYKSVNDDAVRADGWKELPVREVYDSSAPPEVRGKPVAEPVDTKPAA